MSQPRPTTSPLRRLGPAFALAAAVLQAASSRGAVSDCHYVVQHAGGMLDRHARVGEVDRSTVPVFQRLLNQGPHDIRATFDHLGPRVLQRGQSEPARGLIERPVTLLSIECLPARAAAAVRGASPPARLPRQTALGAAGTPSPTFRSER